VLAGEGRGGHNLESILQAQGYTMRAQILNYPDGGLGEVGIYLGW